MIELFNDDSALMDFIGYQPDLFAAPSWPYLKDKGQRKEYFILFAKSFRDKSKVNKEATNCSLIDLQELEEWSRKGKGKVRWRG